MYSGVLRDLKIIIRVFCENRNLRKTVIKNLTIENLKAINSNVWFLQIERFFTSKMTKDFKESKAGSFKTVVKGRI